jgi:hypothetical protein
MTRRRLQRRSPNQRLSGHRRSCASVGSTTTSGITTIVLIMLTAACSSGQPSASHATSTTTRVSPTTVPVTTAAAPTTVAPPSTTVAAVDTSIKVYGDCKTPSFEPTEVILACADVGALLEGLHWTSWTSTRATAVGTLVYNDCSPDCARGQHHSIPGTRVTLTAPVRSAQGVLVFSQVQESPQPPGYATGPYHGGPQPLPTQPD